MNIPTNQPLCDVAQTISLIGGKWKAIILYHLMAHQFLRFSELQRAIPQVTQRMLTLQLRELESDGLISRTIYQQIPPRVEYRLTPLGESIGPIINEMKHWGHKYHREHISARKCDVAPTLSS